MNDVLKKRQEEEDQFIVDALSSMMGGWVPLRVYLRMFPDETKGAIDNRVRRGFWERKVHYFCPEGSQAWVCLPAIAAWASGGTHPRPRGQRKDVDDPVPGFYDAGLQ